MLLRRSRLAACSLQLLMSWSLAVPPARADHPKDVKVALKGLEAGRLAAVDKVFLKAASRDNADRLLALYELGGIYQMAGQPRRSLEFFNQADQVARAYEGRAVVSAGAAGRTAGALLTNDRALVYQGQAYEKVMARTLNALNYLLVGDPEGARVELRKAEEYQRLERERSARAAPDPGPGPGLDEPAVAARYGAMADYVKAVRNSYENAFTYYLASQIYLAQGEDGRNDATVEIKRAFELAPQAPGVQEAYRELVESPGPPASGAAGGSLVVIYATGLMPPLEEVKLALPVQDRLFTLAFPIYRQLAEPEAPLAIQAPGFALRTAPVLDTRRLAVKSLQERMPGILARGVAGALAKGEVQVRAERDYGPLGGLFSKVASDLLTSADRRSWLSLPAEVQVAACTLPPGTTTLTLQGPGWTDRVPLEVAPGSHTFLVVRAFPGFKHVDVQTLKADDGVDSSARPPAPVGQAAASGAKMP